MLVDGSGRMGLFSHMSVPSLPPFQGLTRVKNATDAVGVVWKELKQQCPQGSFRLLVAVDGVNGLWGRTSLKKEDKSPVWMLNGYGELALGRGVWGAASCTLNCAMACFLCGHGCPMQAVAQNPNGAST